MTFWYGVRGFSIGCLAVSALNLVTLGLGMNRILWGWLIVNVTVILVSSYKIWKGK